MKHRALPVLSIDKGIPIPPKPEKRPKRHPMLDMGIGDSVFMRKPYVKAYGYLASWKRYNGVRDWKFEMREMEGGTRVWRIE